jgi:hypothetical protein
MSNASIAWLSLLLASACSSNPVDPCGEPYYGGRASDEAWRSMLDGERLTTVNDAQSPTFTQPSEGQTYSASGTLPRFEWTPPVRTTRRAPRAASARALASGHRAPPRSLWQRVKELFVGTAWAHLPPVTGDVYFLRFRVAGRTCPVSLLTTETFWQVPDDAWTALGGGGAEPVRIEITRAYLRDNRITEGPFRPSQERSFRIVP